MMLSLWVIAVHVHINNLEKIYHDIGVTQEYLMKIPDQNQPAKDIYLVNWRSNSELFMDTICVAASLVSDK